MFTADIVIDTIQTAKKEAVKTFVKNEAIAKSLNEFVDAQTEYTKKAAKAGTDAVTKVASEAVKLAQEAAKYDYAKHVSDAFGSFAKAFETSKK
jgi:hypothetical protein